MAETYGIDLTEPGLLDRRSARWLEVRIRGLLTRPRSVLTTDTRLAHVLFPPKEEKP